MQLDDYLPHIEELVYIALDEDLSQGDITTEALIPVNLNAHASLMAKSSGVLAGIEIAKLIFLTVDPFLEFKAVVKDGMSIQPKVILATIEGSVSSILRGERTALNFLQHLSGVATATSKYVSAVKGLPVQILDTRKTTPGLRVLEKYAVQMGGGLNHRMSLGDMVLIKDNHIAALRKRGTTIKEILEKVRQKVPAGIKVEIETTSVEDALEACNSGADIIMLDNMTIDEMKKAVQKIRHRAIVEASGGVNLDTVRTIAETGVDWISVGALTHSARALDISLELGV